MSKLVEFVVSGVTGSLLGVAASTVFGQSELWPPLAWTAGVLVLYVAGRFIYGRTPMGKGKRNKASRIEPDSQRDSSFQQPPTAGRSRIVIRGGSISENGGDGIHIGRGADVDMDISDVTMRGNKGHGISPN